MKKIHTFSFAKSFLVVLLVALMSHSAVFAGHRVGNGGDHIRGTFIEAGHAVIKYLSESDDGSRLVAMHQLDLAALSRVNSIDTISVSDQTLIDSNGSVVDAIGELNRIVLSQERWSDHFEKERDIYYLVFHELLRAVAIDDDDYVISKSISPFPVMRRVSTRLASTFPVFSDIPLNKIIDGSRISFQGSGCSSRFGGSFVDFDLEKYQLGLALRDFSINLVRQFSDRKNCTILIPYSVPAGKRLLLSQIDFSSKAQLSSKTSAAMSMAAYFGAQGSPTVTQRKTAQTDEQGRFLLRAPALARSSCNGETGILKIQSAGSAQRVTQDGTSLITGEYISASFSLENCTR